MADFEKLENNVLHDYKELGLSIVQIATLRNLEIKVVERIVKIKIIRPKVYQKGRPKFTDYRKK